MATRILVTGAAGHLGGHLAPALVEAGYDVHGMDMVERREDDDRWGFTQAQLADVDALGKLLAGVDVVCHCASIHPWKPYRDDQYIQANVQGTWHLFQAVKDAGVGKVVMTSSIAAQGYHNVPIDQGRVPEEWQFPLGDLYSFTKHAQEDIAELFAQRDGIRTVAIRPPGFMPRGDLATGFALTGCFAVVGDVLGAHVAGVRAILDDTVEMETFEAFNATNAVPYTDAELRALPDHNIGKLAAKYWPEAHAWLVEQGYEGAHAVAIYDLSKAKRLLGWEPRYNFDQWWAEHRCQSTSAG